MGYQHILGKGKDSRADQWEKYGYRENVRLHFIYVKYGYLPCTIIREELMESEAFETEIALIKIIGRRCLGTGPLINLTEGGDGVSGLVITDEYRQKLSEAHARNWSNNEFRRYTTSQFMIEFWASMPEEQKIAFCNDRREDALKQWSDPVSRDTIVKSLQASWDNNQERKIETSKRVTEWWSDENSDQRRIEYRDRQQELWKDSSKREQMLTNMSLTREKNPDHYKGWGMRTKANLRDPNKRPKLIENMTIGQRKRRAREKAEKERNVTNE